MSESNFLANLRGEPFQVSVKGMPTPVVNVTTGSTHTDRQIALMAAVNFRQDEQDTTEEDVVSTAMAFAHFLEHGEFPPG